MSSNSPRSSEFVQKSFQEKALLPSKKILNCYEVTAWCKLEASKIDAISNSRYYMFLDAYDAAAGALNFTVCLVCAKFGAPFLLLPVSLTPSEMLIRTFPQKFRSKLLKPN